VICVARQITNITQHLLFEGQTTSSSNNNNDRISWQFITVVGLQVNEGVIGFHDDGE
jgi:hypothetical protein